MKSGASGPIPILLTARTLHQGGLERDVAKIATYIDRSRYTPHVATFHAGGLRYEEIQAAGVPILHLPVYSMRSRAALDAIFTLRRYIKQHGIQIVHSWDSTALLVGVAARLWRVPALITTQLSYRDILDPATCRWLRLSDHLMHALLVNCEAIRRYMVEDEGVAADRVELCYNGVDTTVFFPAPQIRPPELDGCTLAIGTVCALRPEKNLPLLQEAFALVHKPQAGMKLVIVGSGEQLPLLEQNAARLGITVDSVFIPATADVAKWLHAFDIFVLPSLSEAFSNSLLEAMACGCAVVGSRVGGTPELIGENERGRLFESKNAPDLAARLTELICDPALRRSLGAAAARHAREQLSIEIAAERMAAIYDKVLCRQLRKP